MLEVAMTLIDRLIQLAKSRHESDRSLYFDIIAPLQKDFEALHDDYIKAFQGFRDALKTSTEVMSIEHPIFDLIESDSRQTAHLRSRILAMQSMREDPVFGRLIQAAQAYICSREAGGNTIIHGRDIINGPAYYTIIGLRSIFSSDYNDEEKKIKGIKLIDEIIDEQQQHFAHFQILFSPTKLELLDKRLGRRSIGP